MISERRIKTTMNANYGDFNDRMRIGIKDKTMLLILSALECCLGGISVALESWIIRRNKIATFPCICPGLWTGLFLVITGMFGVVHATRKSIVFTIFRLTSSIIFTCMTGLIYSAFLIISINHEYVWSNVQIMIFVLLGSGVIVSFVHMFYSSRVIYNGEANSFAMDMSDEKESLVPT